MLDSIPPYVGERLGYYVYLYVDPRTNTLIITDLSDRLQSP